MRQAALVALLAASIAIPAVGAPPYEPYPDARRSSAASSQAPATVYGSGVKTYGIGGTDSDFSYRPAEASGTVSAAGVGTATGSFDNYSQMQQMQQEVQNLRGMVEQLNNELELMRKQARERYLDLDNRINQIRGGAPSTSATETSTGAAAPVGGTDVDDKALYDEASELRRQQKFNQSITVLENLLQRSPDGMYAPYCEFWLGELYLAVTPPQMEKSKTHFITLIGNYGDHVKVPDAMYKLGKLFSMQGEKAKARATLNKLIEQHPDKPAANLAKDLLKTL